VVKGTKKPKPLEEYANSSPDLRMREIARIALFRGLNQEKLAQLYRAATGTQVNGSNLKRQFMRTGQAESSTIDTYARVLGVPRWYLDLAGGHWSLELQDKAGLDLDKFLSFHEADFIDGFRDQLADAVKQDDETAVEVLRAFAFAHHGCRLGVRNEERGLEDSPIFRALETHLSERLELRRLLRPRVANDDLFRDLDEVLRQHLGADAAENLLKIIHFALKLRGGHELSAMWNRRNADVRGFSRFLSLRTTPERIKE
jgi:hypothetical protein